MPFRDLDKFHPSNIVESKDTGGQEYRRAIREYWWNLLSSIDQEALDSRIDVQQYGLEDWLFVGDKISAFSAPLTDGGAAGLVARREALKYGISVDEPCTSWPKETQDKIFAFPRSAPFRNTALKNGWNLRNLTTHMAEVSSRATGFESRYWLPFQDTPEKIEDRSVVIGAFLLQRLLKEKKWNGVDALLISSSVLPADLSIRILDFAKEKGIIPINCQPELRDIRMGCAGAAIAFGMMASDPKLRGLDRAVVLALDPMLDLIGIFPDLVSLEHMGTFLPYGDGFEGWAGSPSRMGIGKTHATIQTENLPISLTMYQPQQISGMPQYLEPLFTDERQLSDLSRVSYGSENERHQAVVQEHITFSPEELVERSKEGTSKSKIGDMITHAFNQVLARVTEEVGERNRNRLLIVSNNPGKGPIKNVQILLETYFPPGSTQTASLPFMREGSNSSSAGVLRDMRRRAAMEQDMKSQRPKPSSVDKVLFLFTAIGVIAGGISVYSKSKHQS